MRIRLLLLSLALIGLSNAVEITPLGKAPGANVLYQSVAMEKQDSMMISPIAAASGLAFMNSGAGADSTTKSELLNALKSLGVDTSANCPTRLTANSKTRTLNALFLLNGINAKQQFKNSAGPCYQASVGNLQFANTVQSAKAINEWINKATNGRMKYIASVNAMTSDKIGYLANSAYFKADWLTPFKSAGSAKFFVPNRPAIIVEMMYQNVNCLYGHIRNLNVEVIEIGFADTDITMMFLLPKTLNGLAALEKDVQKHDLTKFSTYLKRANVNVKIPKFKIATNLLLGRYLSSIGVRSLMSKNADLTNITSNTLLTTFKHKAILSINEKGAETSVFPSTDAIPTAPVASSNGFSFIANHGFMFCIKDSTKIHFMGRVSSGTKATVSPNT